MSWTLRRSARWAVAIAALGCVAGLRADSGSNVEGDGTTPLHRAVHAGDVRQVTRLLTDGLSPNAANRYGVTPLSLAADAGSADILRVLIARGGDVKKADAALRDGQSTLMLAARAGSPDAIRLLVQGGGNVNAVERRTGTTALMWAALDDKSEAVAALVRAGADVNARSKVTAYPHTPPGVIGDALEENYSYVGQTVLPRGGWTALMYAARQGATTSAAALVDARANLDAQDPDGTTALGLAVINGHVETTSLLLDRGANPNLADRTGMTPLYAAVDLHTMAFGFGRPNPTPAQVAGSVEMVRRLLARGADPNARLSGRILKRVYAAGDGKLGKGATPYMRAARGGDVLLMRILREAGANPLLTQDNGNSPLLLAAGLGYRGAIGGTEQMALEAIAYSLQHGANVNEVNAAGDSAVHLAATTNFRESGDAAGSLAIVRYLADRGAVLDAKNKQGRTPLESVERAREHGDEIAAFLRSLTTASAASPVPSSRPETPAGTR